MSETIPPFNGDNDKLPKPHNSEVEPQLQLIDYFRELFINAYEEDFNRLVENFRNPNDSGGIVNPSVRVLRDPITFGGLSLDQVVISPNVIIDDTSYDEYFEPEEVAFRAIAASLDDGDGSLFPRKEKLPKHRIFRIKSTDEIKAMTEMGDKRFEKLEAPSIEMARQSSQFIIMAIPEESEYPKVYYVVDEAGVSPVFTEGGEQESITLSMEILAKRARGEMIMPDETFEGGDIMTDEATLEREKKVICELLKTFKRSYSLALIESSSRQTPDF